MRNLHVGHVAVYTVRQFIMSAVSVLLWAILHAVIQQTQSTRISASVIRMGF
jgi:hypothetical protein